MAKFKVYREDKRSKPVEADYFEVEEGGVVVFYEDPGHSGPSLELGDVADSTEHAVEAYSEWTRVRERER